MTTTKEKIRYIAVTGVLAGIVILFSFLMVPVLGLELCFAMVPVGIGAILFGPKTGAILGGVFGFASFFQCFSYSAFGAGILAINPFFAFLTCVPTRILAGFLTGLICKAFKKRHTLGAAVASLAAPSLNTVFFMSALILCFWHTDFIQGFAEKMGTVNPLVFVVLFVGFQGLIEMLSGAVITFPVSKAAIIGLKRR